MYHQPWQDNDNDLKWEQHTSASIVVREYIVCEIAENVIKRQKQFTDAYYQWLDMINLTDEEDQDLYHDPAPYFDDILMGQHIVVWHIAEHPKVIRKQLDAILNRDGLCLYPNDFRIPRYTHEP